MAARKGKGVDLVMGGEEPLRLSLGQEPALFQDYGLRDDCPYPLRSGDANDLGGAEGIDAVHERDADVDFGGLAVGVAGGRSPKDLRQRIFASMRLRACYPAHRFQKAQP